ncbi:hypothetical protein GQ457_03G038590 [Hibiscus cannabinus]
MVIDTIPHTHAFTLSHFHTLFPSPRSRRLPPCQSSLSAFESFDAAQISPFSSSSSSPPLFSNLQYWVLSYMQYFVLSS